MNKIFSRILALAIIPLCTSLAYADGGTISEYMNSGVPDSAAKLVGETRVTGVAATGNNSQANGKLVQGSVVTFTTVTAGSADSAVLPTKNQLWRDDIVILNSGVGTLRVFPSVGGSINALATNAAFLVAPGSYVQFKRTSMLTWIASSTSSSTATAISAAGTNLATATQLTALYSDITTVAASTGVKLVDTGVGVLQCGRNGGANALAVFPPTATNTINGGSAGASVSIATTAFFCCARMVAGTSGNFLCYEPPAA